MFQGAGYMRFPCIFAHLYLLLMFLSLLQLGFILFVVVLTVSLILSLCESWLQNQFPLVGH